MKDIKFKRFKENYNPTIYSVKPVKRFRLIFTLWGNRHAGSISDFDTYDEMQEEMKLLRQFYKDTKRPEKKKTLSGFEYYAFSNGGCYWGYIALDYEEKRIIEIYKDGVNLLYSHKRSKDNEKFNQKTDYERVMDFFFREEDEISENYEWDDGEYDGWLQYKWGDGKNAIGYVEEDAKKKKSNKIKTEPYIEDDYDYGEYDYLQEQADAQYDKEKLKLKEERWG